jgi:hypothetical protein
MPDETALNPLESDVLSAWQKERTTDGRDKPGERLTYKIREAVVLTKFDHTPKDGEQLEPLEVTTIRAGERTVTVTVPPQE